MRFSFNNGTSTISLGPRIKIKDEFVIPNEKEISKVEVSVRGNEEYLEAINFYDQHGELIVAIRGESVKGEMKSLQLQND